MCVAGTGVYQERIKPGDAAVGWLHLCRVGGADVDGPLVRLGLLGRLAEPVGARAEDNGPRSLWRGRARRRLRC